MTSEALGGKLQSYMVQKYHDLETWVRVTWGHSTGCHCVRLCVCVWSDVQANDRTQEVRTDVQSDGQQGATDDDSTQCQPNTRRRPGQSLNTTLIIVYV